MDIAEVDLSCDAGLRTVASVRSSAGLHKDPVTSAAGIIICAIVPAIFWCAVIWWVGHALGKAPNAATMATIGTTIATFLTVIGSAVLSGH